MLKVLDDKDEQTTAETVPPQRKLIKQKIFKKVFNNKAFLNVKKYIIINNVINMKSKIYVKDSYYNRRPFKMAILEYILNVIVYTLILIIATKVFNNSNIYIESIWSALLASIIINLFNITIKPLLFLVTLPITVSTLGFFYPVINLILLKLTSILMYPNFVIKGILVPFIIVIFISVLRMLFEFLIINPIIERRKL